MKNYFTRRYVFLPALFILISIATGCYTPRYVYSPAAHNVPLLSAKGDTKLAINYSSNLPGSETTSDQAFHGRSTGMDVQGAWAINKKFALQGAYFYRTEKNEGDYSTTLDSAVIRYNRQLAEIGFGYYTKLNRGNSLVFQVFGGLGLGNFKFTDNGKDRNQVNYSRYHRAVVSKIYIQPAFQYKSKKLIFASLSSRVSVINFNNVETDYSAQEQANFELDRLASSPVVFWEPAFVNSFGFKKIPGFYLEYQLGLSLLASKRFVDARGFNFSAGIMADLPKLFKKNKGTEKK